MSATCPNGPQGFHIYDVEQADESMIHCLECGVPKTEVAILGELIAKEPPPGSIVLQEGVTGTAWQRMYGGTQAWASTTKRTAVWSAVVAKSRPSSRVWLVYVPPVVR